MLRKFKIKIDGTEYLVEMEELTEPSVAPAPVTAPVAPAPAPVAPAPAAPAAPAPASAPAPAPAAPAGADAQTAPMPGKILELKHSVGDVVAQNDCVLVLEAMKMEKPSSRSARAPSPPFTSRPARWSIRATRSSPSARGRPWKL